MSEIHRPPHSGITADHEIPEKGAGSYSIIADRDTKDAQSQRVIEAQTDIIRVLFEKNAGLESENAGLIATKALVQDQLRQSLLRERKNMIMLIEALQEKKVRLAEKIAELNEKKELIRRDQCADTSEFEFDEEAVSGVLPSIFSMEEDVSTGDLLSAIEELNGTAASIEQKNTDMQREIERLTIEIQVLEQERIRHRALCDCDKRSFQREKLDPHLEKATAIFNRAMQIRQEKDDEKETKRDEIAAIVLTMMRNAQQAQYKRLLTAPLAINALGLADEELEKKARDIATRIVRISQVRSQEIANIIDENGLLDGSDLSIVSYDKQNFTRICRIAGASDDTNGYIGMLASTLKDINTLNLNAIWNEMDKESEIDETKSGPLANKFCEELYGDFELDEEVRDTHNLGELQTIAKRCTNDPNMLPITPAGFHKMLSVVAKVRMMHLANTIENTVDTEHMQAITRHLRRKLNAYVGKTTDDRSVLTCDDPQRKVYDPATLADNPRALLISYLNVGHSKQKVAIARKLSVKDIDNAKNYGMNDIKDPHRFEVQLTREDSRLTVQEGETEPPAHTAIKKILAIFISIFGTDIPDKRLRCAIESGFSNENSTGNNFSFQFTFNYRCQCEGNGRDENNRTKVKEVWVEGKISLYMDSEERKKDHDAYVERKNRKIQRLSGVDVNFHDYLLTLAERVKADAEVVCPAQFDPETYHLSEKEKEAKILFLALTNKDDEGNLINADVIDNLLMNRNARKTLLDAAEKFEKHQVLPRRNRVRFGLQYGTSPTSLNRMASQVIQMITEKQNSLAT